MAPTNMPKIWTLHVNGLHVSADYTRTVYHVTVPNHVTLKDLLNPLAFGANFSTRLRRMDLIQVVTEDLELDVELRVVSVEDKLVHTRVRVISEARDIDGLDEEEPEEELPVLPDGYQVRPVNGRYYVRLTSTNPPITLQTGIETKAEAYAYAVEHAKKAA